jgi:hypothetical protein
MAAGSSRDAALPHATISLAVVYLFEGQDVIVVAVAHSSQEPHYWDERIT